MHKVACSIGSHARLHVACVRSSRGLASAIPVKNQSLILTYSGLFRGFAATHLIYAEPSGRVIGFSRVESVPPNGQIEE